MHTPQEPGFCLVIRSEKREFKVTMSQFVTILVLLKLAFITGIPQLSNHTPRQFMTLPPSAEIQPRK